MRTAFAFWQSKTLLSAVELGVFTQLAAAPLTAQELADRLGLRSRAVYDFLDALVAAGLLHRHGDGTTARYANTEATATFLDRGSPRYLGAALELANERLYPFWGGLTEALRTGQAQSEVRHGQAPFFDELYADPGRAELFLRGMAGVSSANFTALAEVFDFGPYRTVCDVGGAAGHLSITLATRHPHLRCTTFDLPVVEPVTRRTIGSSAVADRITVASGDFFADPLPQADVITMCMILHDWDLDRKTHLIRSAYAALPRGGAFVVMENMIDDNRRLNLSALLSSLNMLIEFGDGFEFTMTDFRQWCTSAGFSKYEAFPLTGTSSAAIAYK
ncbi:methyltransferase [Acrocarpospora sp. B8E8]|uniref:methyltransferase n=1 Tax=Acrocarpospora sp. B8E8 TaxID=3153572 RepID=UPI00325EF02E